MSQAGILSAVNNSPTIATAYVTNSGTAVPSANTLEILGSSPISTSAVGNIITISYSGSSGGITTIDGDSGQGSVTGTTVTLNANTNCGSSVFFSASSATVMDLLVTDANTNTIIGSGSGNNTISGAQNNVLGSGSLTALTSGYGNTVIGYAAATSATSAFDNVIIGNASGGSLADGSENVIIGNDAGSAYNDSESFNIIIGSRVAGVSSETNTTRIGGSLQSAVYIPGIYGQLDAIADGVIVGDSTGLLTFVNPTINAGYVLTSQGTGVTPTWSAVSAVTSLAGDTGGALTGALTLTGGTSGAYFTGSGTTITTSFNYLELPNAAASGNGIVYFNSVPYLHNFSPTSTPNIFLGPNAGNTSATEGTGAIAIGNAALTSLSNANVTDLVAIGNNCCTSVTTSTCNYTVAIGGQCLDQLNNNGSVSYCVLIGESIANSNDFDEIDRTTAIGNGVLSALGFLGSAATSVIIGDSAFTSLSGGQTENTVAIGNLAFGSAANGNISHCVAIGDSVFGGADVSSNYSVAIGASALYSATGGNRNVCVGYNTLNGLVSGAYNLALGDSAGVNLSGSESSNLYLMNGGTASENNVIRIGTQGTGSGEQNTCYIAGIFGSTVSSATSTAVLIDNTGLLGTISSSARYKENIESLGDDSKKIYHLKPKKFNYKKNRNKFIEYGLIAEEVFETFPRLVILNNEGEPESVKYQDLPILLLNELQKQQKVIEDLNKRLKQLEEI